MSMFVLSPDLVHGTEWRVARLGRGRDDETDRRQAVGPTWELHKEGSCKGERSVRVLEARALLNRCIFAQCNGFMGLCGQRHSAGFAWRDGGGGGFEKEQT